MNIDRIETSRLLLNTLRTRFICTPGAVKELNLLLILQRDEVISLEDPAKADITSNMSTPKGMRAVSLPVNATDAVHVYSDDQHIWLQLRRIVATENDISKPSFKSALCLTPGTAHKLGLELLNIADRNKDKQKPKPVTTKTEK